MNSKKLSSETRGSIVNILMGCFGVLCYLYGKEKGIKGAESLTVFAISVTLIGVSILVILTSSHLKKYPLKSIGRVNKDDEMLVALRQKASHRAFHVTLMIIFALVMVTATGIINLNVNPCYILFGILVLMYSLDIIFITIFSNKSMN
ncbi:hypothetical protein K9O30_05985 [Clostridium bowmanii]|uniref:hypothetical protein n=1 Tax=Clostridium bowmanii TaxID=132925 RepID=UPI001C0E86D3|nr:hypothetical protein [Clostridium bowmanii]MBU3188710.1 hypothetical protein [Clostridium bowmanii]MCA1073295.1 hypothetical protein [Clostridium bowmanii]